MNSEHYNNYTSELVSFSEITHWPLDSPCKRTDTHMHLLASYSDVQGTVLR